MRSFGYHILVAATLLLATAPARGYPGPGPWASISPPEPSGGAAQLSFVAGTPHLYNLSVVAGTAGMAVDFRISRRLFVSVSGEVVIPMAPSADVGPTLVLGGLGPRGVRVVLAPRAGLDGYTEGPLKPSVLVGGHALLDVPIAPDGAVRAWVGPRYVFSTRPGKTWRSHYLFLLGGTTFHVSHRIDLGVEVGGAVLHRTNVGDDCGCWAPFHALTFTFQFTGHLGAVRDDRAVIPPLVSAQGGQNT